MAGHAKLAQQLARQLFKLSLEDGAVSPERVAGVLDYVEKHRPPNPLIVLRAYQRLVAAELSRGQAVVEHAGPISEPVLQRLASALIQKYRRPITASSRSNPALIAGLRVHIGDDVYESSIAGQLAALAASL
jgi:F-type H+-transporting ATPase subunit delta